ncbi:hypothetical protein MMC29_004403, partial [Sticta canariensis]|nr:hypothetical protein [Sticta canariensis]
MNSGKIASKEQLLRLSISESPNEPSGAWNDREGWQAGSREDFILQEEDIHSVVGVSISRAQTRLMSPLTSTAEKVAAFESTSDGRFLEGTDEDGSQDQAIMSSQSASTEPPQNPRDSHCSEADLPSPWKATAGIFERAQSRDGKHLASRSRTTGPMNMVTDLNIKRLLSSFHMLSLPGGASLRDLSVSTISSIFGGSKANSQLPKSGSGPTRASTVSSPSSGMTVGQFGTRPAATVSPSRQDSGSEVEVETNDPPQIGRKEDSSGLVQGPGPSVIHNSSRAASLRRVKSDRSSMLRRTKSGGSTLASLGDDSRWEHVQDQVNSRFKAIVDSLQDSNIKLPSLPTINLNSLRPDFTRNRAWSDTRKPTSFQDANFDDAAIHPDRAGGPGSRALNDGWPGGSDVAHKASKPVLSRLDRALDQLTGDVVIMGGYRGSVLRSAKPPNRQLWVPVKVGLNIRKVNLEVGLSREDEENMEESIIPSGMLSHIGPVDMGRRLLKRLRGCANAQQGKLRVHDYGYDWRLSPDLLSSKLVAFLETLPSNARETPTRERGATVIAHSLGGLITRHAVNQRPELFAGVVYAGTPQHCINILGPMRNGDDVLLSSRVLTAQVNFTLRTSFLLLPEDGKCFVDKHTKEEYPVDFFDVEDWKRHAFSPCIAPTLPAAGQPEKKGILGSVSGSLPSLPLPVKRTALSLLPSRDPPPESGHAAFDATHPALPALDPHPGASATAASVSTHCTIPLPAALSYLERTLAATVAFKHGLTCNRRHRSRNQYPPLSILYSTSVPTVLAARVASRDAIRCADAYDDLAFGSGDGVCLARAAMLPPGYECTPGGRVRTERGHVGLLGDLEA